MDKKSARTATGRSFARQEARLLERLGRDAEGAVTRNDDFAVFEALRQALAIAVQADGRRPEKSQAVTRAAFERYTNFRLTDAVHEFVTSCLNLERYGAALEMMRHLTAVGLIENDADALRDRAELLARVGRGEEAERLLLEAVAERTDETGFYTALADIHYHWQETEEERDFRQAEDWLYQAFDLGLSKSGDEAARDLLEHLGDVCLDRLRRQAENELLILLKVEGLGWRTLAELRDNVWQDGPSCRLLRHLAELFSANVSGEERERRLRVLFAAYEHLPQESLGGYSAFERTELVPPGRHESRVMQELVEAFAQSRGDNRLEATVLISEEFHSFQRRFMDQLDGQTGRRRAALVAEERSEIRRRFEDDDRPWLGFLRYREK